MNESKIMDELLVDLCNADTQIRWLSGIMDLLTTAYMNSKMDDSNVYVGAFQGFGAMLLRIQDTIERGKNDFSRLRELLEGTGAEEAEVGA